LTAPETPRRLTPTERAHEIMLAALHRTPVKASEEVEITRNAKGDYQYRVAGVAGEGEELAEVALRVLSIARSMDDDLPLSRVQEAGRKYLPSEK
jgi:NTP pyrophosphatase (non-canonical NTP hydrolase)